MEVNEQLPSEQQQLAWSQEIPHYGDKLLKRLEEFRKSTILYDVRIQADGGEFNAHKVILAACGGIFRTCFIDEKKKMISSSTDLKLNCPAQGLKPIIKFAYTGALIVTKRNAIATMMAAEVTQMKEVQEICADIALKEFGWIISFQGNKDVTVIERIQKVLSAHASCFYHSNDDDSEYSVTEGLPFLEDVRSDFPDFLGVYQKLAMCLTRAENLMINSKSKTGNDESDKSNNNVDGMSSGLESKKSSESESTTEVVQNGTQVIAKSETVQPLTTVKENPSPPATPKSVENIKMKNTPASPPSRKPRTSVKTKAAPPPPPSPKQREVAPKSPASQPPARPHKLPTKVPPPRPKPPSVKKISAEEEINETEVDYDDSLNPFA